MSSSSGRRRFSDSQVHSHRADLLSEPDAESSTAEYKGAFETIGRQLELEEKLHILSQQLLQSYKETQQWAFVGQLAQGLVASSQRVGQLKQQLEKLKEKSGGIFLEIIPELSLPREEAPSEDQSGVEIDTAQVVLSAEGGGSTIPAKPDWQERCNINEKASEQGSDKTEDRGERSSVALASETSVLAADSPLLSVAPDNNQGQEKGETTEQSRKRSAAVSQSEDSDQLLVENLASEREVTTTLVKEPDQTFVLIKEEEELADLSTVGTTRDWKGVSATTSLSTQQDASIHVAPVAIDTTVTADCAQQETIRTDLDLESDTGIIDTETAHSNGTIVSEFASESIEKSEKEPSPPLIVEQTDDNQQVEHAVPLQLEPIDTSKSNLNDPTLELVVCPSLGSNPQLASVSGQAPAIIDCKQDIDKGATVSIVVSSPKTAAQVVEEDCLGPTVSVSSIDKEFGIVDVCLEELTSEIEALVSASEISSETSEQFFSPPESISIEAEYEDAQQEPEKKGEKEKSTDLTNLGEIVKPADCTESVVQEEKSTEPADLSEPVVKGEESTEPADLSEPVVKGEESTEPADLSEPVVKGEESTEPADLTEPVVLQEEESTEPVVLQEEESTEPADLSEPVVKEEESTEPADLSEPVVKEEESTEPADLSEPVVKGEESTESADLTEPADLSEPVVKEESTEPADLTEPVVLQEEESTEPADLTEPVVLQEEESTEPADLSEPVVKEEESTEPADLTEPVVLQEEEESTEPLSEPVVKEEESTEPADLTEPVVLQEEEESTEPADLSEPVVKEEESTELVVIKEESTEPADLSEPVVKEEKNTEPADLSELVVKEEESVEPADLSEAVVKEEKESTEPADLTEPVKEEEHNTEPADLAEAAVELQAEKKEGSVDFAEPFVQEEEVNSIDLAKPVVALQEEPEKEPVKLDEPVVRLQQEEDVKPTKSELTDSVVVLQKEEKQDQKEEERSKAEKGSAETFRNSVVEEPQETLDEDNRDKSSPLLVVESEELEQVDKGEISASVVDSECAETAADNLTHNEIKPQTGEEMEISHTSYSAVKFSVKKSLHHLTLPGQNKLGSPLYLIEPVADENGHEGSPAVVSQTVMRTFEDFLQLGQHLAKDGHEAKDLSSLDLDISSVSQENGTSSEGEGERDSDGFLSAKETKILEEFLNQIASNPCLRNDSAVTKFLTPTLSTADEAVPASVDKALTTNGGDSFQPVVLIEEDEELCLLNSNVGVPAGGSPLANQGYPVMSDGSCSLTDLEGGATRSEREESVREKTPIDSEGDAQVQSNGIDQSAHEGKDSSTVRDKELSINGHRKEEHVSASSGDENSKREAGLQPLPSMALQEDTTSPVLMADRLGKGEDNAPCVSSRKTDLGCEGEDLESLTQEEDPGKKSSLKAELEENSESVLTMENESEVGTREEVKGTAMTQRASPSEEMTTTQTGEFSLQEEKVALQEDEVDVQGSKLSGEKASFQQDGEMSSEVSRGGSSRNEDSEVEQSDKVQQSVEEETSEDLKESHTQVVLSPTSQGVIEPTASAEGDVPTRLNGDESDFSPAHSERTSSNATTSSYLCTTDDSMSPVKTVGKKPHPLQRVSSDPTLPTEDVSPEITEENDALHMSLMPSQYWQETAEGQSTEGDHVTSDGGDSKSKKMKRKGTMPSMIRSSIKTVKRSFTAKKRGQTINLDDESMKNVSVLKPLTTQEWDPTCLLEELYSDYKQGVVTTINPSGEAARHYGYLDKLPTNRTKANVMAKWRRRYFRAQEGNIYYYQDRTATRALGFIHLTSSRVVPIPEKMQIQIIPKDGKSIMLKAPTVDEFQTWHRALLLEAAHPTLVAPSSPKPAIENPTVIIDVGACSVRAGLVREDPYPEIFFPAVCSFDAETFELIECGHAALLPDNRIKAQQVYPRRVSLRMDRQNKDINLPLKAMDAIISQIVMQLDIDPQLSQLLMTLPPTTPEKERDDLIDLLLSTFGFAGICLQDQTQLALYSYNTTTGIIVDIGNHITVVPYIDGYAIEAGITWLPYGGNAITESLKKLVTQKGLRYFSETEMFVNRFIKESLCYVSQNYEQDSLNCEENPKDYLRVAEVDRFQLPDHRKMVTLDSALFKAPEGLFTPHVWGKDVLGLHEIVWKAIQACPIDQRREVSKKIFLSGGSSAIPGLKERLQKELQSLAPTGVAIDVQSNNTCHHAAYCGASVLASLGTFHNCLVTFEDWSTAGAEALKKWTGS